MNDLTILKEKGISTELWSAMQNSLFPGATDQSLMMVWDYCAARKLDVMLKPVHIVPMYVKDKNTGKGAMRDIVMPGIGLYRIQADRAGNYAGMSSPCFGPDITKKLSGVEVTFPEWCEMSVSKLIGDRIVEFYAREYWLENYATSGRDTEAPNSMWKKRPRAQLIKCTEAQALRKAWPELGSQPTADEMEGKSIYNDAPQEKAVTGEVITPDKQPEYSQDDFDKNFPKWKQLIDSGKRTPEQIISMIESKATLSEEQKNQIRGAAVL